MTGVDPTLYPLSQSYRLTEFRVETYGGEEILLDSHRYFDIITTLHDGNEVYPVLKYENRHLVPRPDGSVRADTLVLPDYMTQRRYESDIETVLVAATDHARRLVGI